MKTASVDPVANNRTKPETTPRKIHRQETPTEEAAMNPAIPKTEPPPSTRLRKAVFGGSLSVFWKAGFVASLLALQSLALGAEKPKNVRFFPTGRISVQASHVEGLGPFYDEQFIGWDGSAITVDFRAKPDRSYRLTAFFTEVYWSETGKRVEMISAEGNLLETVDLVEKGARKPVERSYVVKDGDGNGWIRVSVQAAPTAGDKNSVLNALTLEDAASGEKIVFNCTGVYLKNLLIGPILDGRPIVGNGSVLATFVAPLEMPESPVIEVHDKIARLWLGYSSPQMSQIGLAGKISDANGKSSTVGACDKYAYEDGALVMETDLPLGHLRTETFGAWDRPVMIRRFVFTPGKELKDFRLSTAMQLFADYSAEPPKGDAEARRVFEQAYTDKREIPPTLIFHETETMELDKKTQSVAWSYGVPYYRKVAVKALEAGAEYQLQSADGSIQKDAQAVFAGKDHGRLKMEIAGNGKPVTLTVVLAFGKSQEEANQFLNGTPRNELMLQMVQKHWQDWYESGTSIQTGNEKLDHAYRNQMLACKMALDAELGGLIVGGRYLITTVWARDGGVGVAALLAAGHYEEAKKALRFFAKHATWDVVNHCMHANTHASGRVQIGMAGAGQPSVEEVVQPFGVNEGKRCEWQDIQMSGPQLDGMGYWLYNLGSCERLTRDTEFIREIWPFAMRVADSLASDIPQVAPSGQPNRYIDVHKRFQRYYSKSGLIVDNCYEANAYREYTIMNGIAVQGFREAHRLSKLLGGEIPLWKKRADQIDAGIKSHLIVSDPKNGHFIREWTPRPWQEGGQEAKIGNFGYAWTMASVIPYFNWRDPIFKESFAKQVAADGKITGWGMWWGETAHAAFEADQPETAWNYLSQMVDALPVSGMNYEHHQDVGDQDGNLRHVTLNLFGFAYLNQAVIRGLAGIGYDNASQRYFIRPQIPMALSEVKSKARIGKTWLDITASGAGESVAKFTIDGQDQPLKNWLDAKWLDDKRHSVAIQMR
jgi:hypothetical protein